ncbi:DUF147 protein, partial [human gut metagenome]
RHMDQESYMNFFEKQFLAERTAPVRNRHWWQRGGRAQ